MTATWLTSREMQNQQRGATHPVIEMLNASAGDSGTCTPTTAESHPSSASPLAAVVRSKGFVWLAVPPLHCDRLYW